LDPRAGIEPALEASKAPACPSDGG